MMSFDRYDPRDHYWIVGSDDEQVYASARGAFVSVNDTTYIDWVDNGGTPTRIAALADLKDVLRTANVAPYHQVTSYRIVRRIEAAGLAAAAVALLDQYPTLKMRFLTLPAVPAEDQDARNLVTALGLSPDVILAPE